MRSALHRAGKHPRRLALLAAGCAWLAAACPAAAQLGGVQASVEADRASFGATLTTVASGDYVVDTLTLPNSTQVREFVGADGEVFAVSWRGPGRPDLRQLLGPGFSRLQSARPRLGRTRMPLGMGANDLVIHTGGHPGVFWGAAYLPAHKPADFPRSAFQ